MTSPGDHDLLVAQRLGFILAPAVGLWLGWLQRSWRRAMVGSGLGLLIGWLYFLLGSGGEVRAITLVVLSVLGGAFAASCGSNRSDWLRGLAGRFAKGLLAGFLLALVYTALISLGPLVFWPKSGNIDYLGAYLRMMWRAGPFALGLSGALLFLSIRWAVGLTRAREAGRTQGNAVAAEEMEMTWERVGAELLDRERHQTPIMTREEAR